MGTHLRALSKSYQMKCQHDRVWMIFKYVYVLWTASALEGLRVPLKKLSVSMILLTIDWEVRQGWHESVGYPDRY